MLNADVGWLLLLTKRLLAGGTYSHDFFEVNPPMILYLYIPAILLAKIFSINIAILFRAYVFILATVSLLISNKLLKQIINKEDTVISAILLTSLAIIFLILPLGDFGQRENFCIILITPYLILMAGRLQKIAVSSSFAILIGILAGLGFAIKPYFLAVFLLIEINYIYQFRTWKRTEALIISAVIFLYLMLLITLHLDYLTIILPLITKFYYQDVSARTWVVLKNPFAIFYYFSVVLFLIRYKNNEYKELSKILLLSATGFYLAYFMQQTIWYYHILPMFSFSFLLYTLLLSSLVKQKIVSRSEYICLALFFMTLCLYMVFRVSYVSLGVLYYPAAYFLGLLFLFAIILYGENKNPFKVSIILAMIFIVNFLFYKNIQHTYFNKNIFLFSVFLFSLFFALFVPKKPMAIFINSITAFGIGIPIFLFLSFQVGFIFGGLGYYRELISPLLQFMKNNSTKSVYFFTDSNEFAFPAVTYSGQNYFSRFGCLTLVPLFKNINDASEYKYSYYNNKKLMDFYIDDLNEDIQLYKPDMVLVDTRGKGYIGIIQPDYIKFFSQKSSFQQLWKSYHYYKTVSNKPLYKFDVYVRV